LGKAFFVTATDTEIGKTFITAGLAKAAQLEGRNIGISKPISCGGIDDPLFYKKLLRISDSIDEINPIRFKKPLAPYSAKKSEKVKIDIPKIKKHVHSLRKWKDITFVEGLGGALVPIKKDYYVCDLIKDLNIPCIIVARAGLGTINHTLMTIKILKRGGVKIAGIILNGYKGKELSEKSNAQVIEELSGIAVIGKIKAKSSFNSLVNQIEKQEILRKLL
jgi:dethiobiotin synthetase